MFGALKAQIVFTILNNGKMNVHEIFMNCKWGWDTSAKNQGGK
jgi:hypothetical protein